MKPRVSPEPVSTTKRPPRTRPLFPFLDLKAQYATIAEEVAACIAKVLESQQLILGPDVQSLETELAAFVGCKYCIGCASGSDALLLALMALEIGAGDEVITTPFTFVATAGSIARLQAIPVFVDIDPVTYNIDPGCLARAITPRTRAITPVHLFGLMADMGAIRDIAAASNLPVIEDAAQAIAAAQRGTMAGNSGAIGCFSFFPSKNLGAAGDGGMLCTNDTELADRLRVLRAHGSRKKYHYERLGVNSRLDTLQAAILRVKLRHLESWTAARRRNAAAYRRLFADAGLSSCVQLPAEPPGYRHVYNQFTIRTADRDGLRNYLAAEGIPTEIYYPLPLHLQPAFAYLGYKPNDFPQAELASKQVLALPIFPDLTQEQQRSVVQSIAEFSEVHRLST
jgi:dTDP-4-amino-4,6-dideoxygalactose transaminase